MIGSDAVGSPAAQVPAGELAPLDYGGDSSGAAPQVTLGVGAGGNAFHSGVGPASWLRRGSAHDVGLDHEVVSTPTITRCSMLRDTATSARDPKKPWYLNQIPQ